MADKQILTAYNGEIAIEFNPDRHTYKIVGERYFLVSVTGATGMINKPFLIPWAVNLAGEHLRKYLANLGDRAVTANELLPVVDEAVNQYNVKKEEATTVGSAVHDFAMNFAQAKIDGKPEPEFVSVEGFTDDQIEQYHNGIDAFIDWYASHDVQFHAVERLLYSKHYKYVGTTDVVLTIGGKKLIGDYKTSKSIYSEYRFQLAGYRQAYEEETGEKLDGGVLLHFDKDTGAFTPHFISNDDYKKDLPVFLACLTIKERDKELARK